MHKKYPTLLLWFFIATSQMFAQAPVPSIGVVGYSQPNPSVSGMAPFSVNVDGIASSLGAGTLLTARFQWDFGDNTGTSEFNTLTGWGGAHVYNEPGTYTLSLTVTNENHQIATTNITVQVSADIRTLLHVAANGNDSNDGLTPQMPIRTMGEVQDRLADNMRVMFRRGDTFDCSTNRLWIEDLENLVVSAYGSGPRPIFMGPSFDPNAYETLIIVNSEYFASPTTGNSNVTIEHLSLQTPTPASPATEYNHWGIQVHGKDNYNITVRDCYFLDVGSCIMTTFGSWPQSGNTVNTPTGILMQGNVGDEFSGYFTFFSSYNTTLLGNTILQGSHTQWLFRFYCDRVFIYHNIFQQPASTLEECAIAGGRHCGNNGLILPGDCDPSSGNWDWGEHAYIANNHFDGTLRLGYDYSNGNYSYYQWFVVENNRFTRLAANQPPTPTLRHWRYTRNFTLRNNIFEGPFGNGVFSGLGVSNIHFHNNTGIDQNNGNSLGYFYDAQPTAGAFDIANNLWVSPNYHPGQEGSYPFTLSITWPGMTAFSCSHNAWPERAFGSNGEMSVHETSVDIPTWQAYPETTGEIFHDMTLADLDGQWTPMLGTPPIGAGIQVPGVFTDFYGNLRPTSGPLTIGAVEVSAPLAVELAELSALPFEGRAIRLEWGTVAEKEDRGFDVQRSDDGVHFHSIGWQDGHGTTSTANYYSFLDETVFPNVAYYYRLRQIDFDGSIEVSDVVSAVLRSDLPLQVVIPNPVKEQAEVVFYLITESSINLDFFNLFGQRVHSEMMSASAGQNRTTMDLSWLPSGCYFLVLETNGERRVVKVVKE